MHLLTKYGLSLGLANHSGRSCDGKRIRNKCQQKLRRTGSGVLKVAPDGREQALVSIGMLVCQGEFSVETGKSL